MKAIEGLQGKKYLSPTNVPVVVAGVKGDKVLLEVLVSGNTVEVPQDYELKNYDPRLMDKITRLALGERETNKQSPIRKETSTMDNETTTKKKRGGISAIIDPLLFEGGKTVPEIVALVKEKNPSLAEGRNLVVNVRVRMFTLQKKGYKLEEDDRGAVKLVQ